MALRWRQANWCRKTTNRLRAIETSFGSRCTQGVHCRRKTTNRLRAIETNGLRGVQEGGTRRRKTTNRLRAIETRTGRLLRPTPSPVARQLIAFGRLKHWSILMPGTGVSLRRKTTNRLRAIETKAVRISNVSVACRRKTTNRLRAIETYTTVSGAMLVRAVARQLIAFGRLKPTTKTGPPRGWRWSQDN